MNTYGWPENTGKQNIISTVVLYFTYGALVFLGARNSPKIKIDSAFYFNENF